MKNHPVRTTSRIPPPQVRPSEIVAYAISFTIFLVLFLILSFLLFEIYKFIYHHPVAAISAGAKQLIRVMTTEMFVFALLSLPLVWWIVRILLTRSLVILVFQLPVAKRLIKPSVRVLGALPTIILGNILMVLLHLVGYSPSTETESGLLLLLIVTIVAMPTALQVGQEILDDFDKSSLQHARSLGLSNFAVGSLILLPQFEKSLNACVTFSLGRVIVESYIVLTGSTYGMDVVAVGVVDDVSSLFDLAKAMYSAMSVQSNFFLIILLLFFGLLTNLWSHGLVTSPRSP